MFSKVSFKSYKFAFLACCIALFAGCRRPQNVEQNPPRTREPRTGNQGNRTPQNTRTSDDSNSKTKNPAINMLLGNPSNAARDANNYLLLRPQNAISYSNANGGPNWVSWHLDKSDLGTARRSEFMPDPLLPAEMQIRPSDYRGTGYDRGHVCPSGDRTRSQSYNKGAFTMSNMLPQAPALNQHVWKDLETYERSLTKKNELYIIAGGVGSVGRIAKNRVNVPQFCWKILLVLPNGNNDLQRINANTRVIAVLMPNLDTPQIANAQWTKYITNVARLEQMTGNRFFTALPADVQRALKQKIDSGRA